MAREVIILQCTEAADEGKPRSQYVTTRNKKSLLTPGRVEKGKFNPHLKNWLMRASGWFGLQPAQILLLVIAPIFSLVTWLAAGDLPSMFQPNLRKNLV